MYCFSASTQFSYNPGEPTEYPSSRPGFFPPLYRCTRINEPLDLPALNGSPSRTPRSSPNGGPIYLLPNHLDAVSMEGSYSIGSEAGRSLRNREPTPLSFLLHHSLHLLTCTSQLLPTGRFRRVTCKRWVRISSFNRFALAMAGRARFRVIVFGGPSVGRCPRPQRDREKHLSDGNFILDLAAFNPFSCGVSRLTNRRRVESGHMFCDPRSSPGKGK